MGDLNMCKEIFHCYWESRVIKVAHSLAHKIVQNEQLKQWMQCMQCEIFLGNLVLVDFK